MCVTSHVRSIVWKQNTFSYFRIEFFMYKWLAIPPAIGLILFDAVISGPAGLISHWLLFVDLVLAIGLLLGQSFVVKAHKYIYLILAFVYRCLLLSQPAFSNDTKRYLSDGLMWQSGINPYLIAPTFSNIDHNSITTIYPPLAELMFLFISLGGSVSLYPFFFGVVEFLVLVFFFVRAKSKKSIQSFYFLAFLPLLVRETYREGHFEAVPVYLFLLAFFFREPIKHHCYAGMAILIKFWGILFIPKFIKARKLSSLIIYILLFLFAALPLVYYSYFFEGLSGAKAYFRYWTFGQPLLTLTSEYFPLEKRILVLQLAVFVIAFFLTIRYLVTNQVFLVYLQKLLCLLFLTPVLHPWYFLIFLIPALVSRKGWFWQAALLLTGHNYICYLEPNMAFLSFLPSLPLLILFFKRPLRLKLPFDHGMI